MKSLVALTLTSLLLASSVFSQTRSACAERDILVKGLYEKYGETLQSFGLHQNNSVVEVYASDETGTWTILITNPSGLSCLMASGLMWGNAVPGILPEDDSI